VGSRETVPCHPRRGASPARGGSPGPRFASPGKGATIGLQDASAEPAGRHDWVHQQVLGFLRAHPRIARQHAVAIKAAGVYKLDSHDVAIEWQHAPVPGRSGCLVVVDGPLRQPLADYLARNEANAVYSTHAVAKTSALHHVPKERRMTFDDKDKNYTRLEAMAVAREQASIREKAADCINVGRDVPDDLLKMYKRTLRKKLRRARHRENDPSPEGDENRDPAPNSVVPMGVASAKLPPDQAHRAPKAALMVSRDPSLNGASPSARPSYLPPQAAHRQGSSPSWHCVDTSPARSMSPALIPSTVASRAGATSPKLARTLFVAAAWPLSPSSAHGPQWRLLH